MSANVTGYRAARCARAVEARPRASGSGSTTRGRVVGGCSHWFPQGTSGNASEFGVPHPDPTSSTGSLLREGTGNQSFQTFSATGSLSQGTSGNREPVSKNNVISVTSIIIDPLPTSVESSERAKRAGLNALRRGLARGRAARRGAAA